MVHRLCFTYSQPLISLLGGTDISRYPLPGCQYIEYVHYYALLLTLHFITHILFAYFFTRVVDDVCQNHSVRNGTVPHNDCLYHVRDNESKLIKVLLQKFKHDLRKQDPPSPALVGLHTANEFNIYLLIYSSIGSPPPSRHPLPPTSFPSQLPITPTHFTTPVTHLNMQTDSFRMQSFIPIYLPHFLAQTTGSVLMKILIKIYFIIQSQLINSSNQLSPNIKPDLFVLNYQITWNR